MVMMMMMAMTMMTDMMILDGNGFDHCEMIATMIIIIILKISTHLLEPNFFTPRMFWPNCKNSWEMVTRSTLFSGLKSVLPSKALGNT